jgi:hypothetical protein
MSKIKMSNVKITATNGGNIHNYNNIEITDSILKFKDNGFNITMDESVNFIEQIAKARPENLYEMHKVINALKIAKPEIHEEIVRKSFLQRFLSGVKDIKPFIDILFKWKELNP